MSSRAGLRFLHTSRLAFRPQQQQIRRQAGRRWQSTDSATATASEGAFARFWNSPVGPKTVHFWDRGANGRCRQWGLVLAGISDFARPAEKLSLTQNVALMATGAIWTRWCLIIKPRNILKRTLKSRGNSLATVNFFLGCVGLVQVSRITMYNQSLTGESTAEAMKQEGANLAKAASDTVKDGAAKVKSAAH
ncbi:MAG: hypothetical protein LQ340_005643 [Diploschistes diacapsis]|nr:MAG: hypothetical protein LQ340_005643 [Diploschistes diacapsis]